MAQERVSVRALVEFTLHGEDIRPGGSLRDMQEGMLGHKARQKLLTEGWQAEVPVSMEVPLEDDDTLLVAGRMDAYLPESTPRVEEIKLWQGREAPETPAPAHWAQAVCYGHMLCVQDACTQVQVRVAYVDSRGKVRAAFEQLLSAQECEALMAPLLEAYMRRRQMIRRHIRARNASLCALQFPFSAYRAGQREMAVQVYTAIRMGRRLFAGMPTGTGKSAATLFPALKALGMGLTDQVYYLTARTTQRQGPLDALRRMRAQPLHLWTLVLDAKDKQCPHRTVCHPDWCQRAKGHFLRDAQAMDQMLREEDWSPERIRQVAQEHQLCPFEFSLSLAELADFVVCDYNYALDPAVHIQRVFERTSSVTLLIDEAHNLSDRTREMLMGELDTPRLRRLRTLVGKNAGRKHPLYQAMAGMINALIDLPRPEDAQEGQLDSVPQSVDLAAERLMDALADAQKEHAAWQDAGEEMTLLWQGLRGFLRARRRNGKSFAYLWQGQKYPRLTAFPLSIAEYLRETTAGMQGVIFFSATLEPLGEMKLLLGGEEEDACFAMPSPFEPGKLLVVQQSIDTRYQRRAQAAEGVARCIRQLAESRPGRYMAFFPSFAFLDMAAACLGDWPCQKQRRGMTQAERESFLAPYRPDGENVMSLCVMGGVFAEGIDLPGRALDGVVIVGVGLPQVGLFQETLRSYYEERFGYGFRYAYQIPGMQKVAQAVGRVIRTESDRGVAILLDERYRQGDYRALLPSFWQVKSGDMQALLQAFWDKE